MGGLFEQHDGHVVIVRGVNFLVKQVVRERHHGGFHAQAGADPLRLNPDPLGECVAGQDGDRELHRALVGPVQGVGRHAGVHDEAALGQQLAGVRRRE